MGCVASRPPVLGEEQRNNAQSLRSISKKLSRQHKSEKAARYTVKDVSTRSANVGAGTGVLLQRFGSGTSQSVQSFTISATGGGQQSLEGETSPLAPPVHAASGASSLGTLGSLGSLGSNASALAATGRGGMSDTLRSDAGPGAASGPLSPHATPAADAADAASDEAATATPGAAAAAVIIPAAPPATATVLIGTSSPDRRPQSPPSVQRPPPTPQQQPRPARRSSASHLARISEAGSTFPPPHEAAPAVEPAAASPAAPAREKLQQLQSAADDAERADDAADAAADSPASKRAKASSHAPLAADAAPAASEPVAAQAADMQPSETGSAETPAMAAELSAEAASQPQARAETGAASSEPMSRETGSSAATALIWNEGDADDDPEFWAKLEADSGRATGSSVATSSMGDAASQALNDSARSSSGARPGSRALFAMGPPKGSIAAGCRMSDMLKESARDVGSIEGWQALAAQIMGEVSDDSVSAAGNCANPFAGSGDSGGSASAEPPAAAVVPLEEVEARPGAYIYIQYAIGEELGEGAFGKAYKAVRHRDSQAVVMKTMTRTTLTEKDKLEAKNEVRVLAAMDHPNIVQYYEAYLTSNGGMTIVMEFCDGGDLDSVIKRQAGALVEEVDLMRAFVQVLLALQYVHSKGIVHRDLKTNNVFRCAAGDVLKLGDFGIAKQLLEAGAQAHTMVGTPYYMSPELLQGKAYDAKADIWSAGCILHELAGLKKTFEAPSLATMYSRIMEGTFKPIPDSYSPELHSLVGAMLQKEPRHRPTAAAILAMPYVRQHVQVYSAHARRHAQRRRASIRRCLAGYLDDAEAAEWSAVMEAEPPAAVDDSVAADTGSAAAAAAAAAAEDVDSGGGIELPANPFGTPNADLMATLSGKAPSSLDSYESKSSAGSSGFWSSVGATTAFGRTSGSTAKTKTAKELHLERWRKEQAELDELLKASMQSEEFKTAAAEDAAQFRQLQETLRAMPEMRGITLPEALQPKAREANAAVPARLSAGGSDTGSASSKPPRTSRFSVSQAISSTG